MIVFPNCKINLGLKVTGKRIDGYHNLQTLLYPLSLTDVLEIVPDNLIKNIAGTDAEHGIACVTSGLPVLGNLADNICVKAFHLLKKDFPDLPPVSIYLYKAIPMGAGLGGGSSDGAFMLTLLNNRFSLGLSQQQLLHYAIQLGSDCPFFIINKPCFATGRGEILEETPVNLSGFTVVLINPGIHINTGWAFSQLALSETVPASPSSAAILDIVRQPVDTWKNRLINDFEAPAEKNYPEIAGIKNGLYRYGAVFAGMTGSGSTVFGLFNRQEKLTFHFPGHYHVTIV